jgi:VHS domain
MILNLIPFILNQAIFCTLAGSDNMSQNSNMSDNLMEKVTSLGERLKITGTEVSRKVSAGMSSMSFKMKELFQGQLPAEKIVEEATSEAMDGPDWSANLEICDMMNSGNDSSIEFIHGIKKRIMVGLLNYKICH